MSTSVNHRAKGLALAVCLGLAAGISACGGGGDAGSGGAGAGGGSGGAGGGGTPAPSLVESCEKICDKQTALECSTITADQCKQSCPYLEQNLGGVCVEEYEVYYACQADLEYQCVQGYPNPVSPEQCFDASYGISECTQKAPCISYCKQAAAQPCGPEDEEACVAQCQVETSYQSDGNCQSDLQQLRTCQGMDGALGCTGDSLTTIGCAEQIYEYAYCFALEENDWCEGYCFAVETVGCAPGGIEECLLSCQADKYAGGASCDYYHEDLIECRTQQGIDCSGGAISDAGCEAQLMQYQSCVSPP